MGGTAAFFVVVPKKSRHNAETVKATTKKCPAYPLAGSRIIENFIKHILCQIWLIEIIDDSRQDSSMKWEISVHFAFWVQNGKVKKFEVI